MFFNVLYDNHNSHYSTEISGEKCFISSKMSKLFVFIHIKKVREWIDYSCMIQC